MIYEKIKNIGFIANVVLFIFAVIFTIGIIFLLDPLVHFKTFTLTLALLLICELLFFGYIGIGFISSIVHRLAVGIYVAIGYVIGMYIVINITTIVVYHIAYRYIHESVYLAFLIFEGFILILLVGFLFIINIYKLKENRMIKGNNNARNTLTAEVNKLYTMITTLACKYSNKDLNVAERELKLLAEKLFFCTDFGREKTEKIEQSIIEGIAKLDVLCHEIEQTKAKKQCIVKDIVCQIERINCMLDEREAMLKL